MTEAKHVKNISNGDGPSSVYRINPSVSYKGELINYVLATGVELGGLQETILFPCDAEGTVTEWIELPGSGAGDVDVHAAVMRFVEEMPMTSLHMKSAIVIAVDPGKMTGYAVLVDGEVFLSGQMEWFEFLNWFEAIITDKGNAPVVVCESFTITPATIKKSPQHWSLEAIGAIKFLLMRERLNPPIMQQPSTAMRFAPNDKLQSIGWYTPGKEHANDAARHLLVYGVTKQLIDLNVFRDLISN